MSSNQGKQGWDFADVFDRLMKLGGPLWTWGLGILVVLGIGILSFRSPLARMLLILALLAAGAVAIWFFYREKGANVVVGTIVGVIVLSILPIHGYVQSRPSKANFCKTYLAEKHRYLARYDRTTGDPMQDLANGIGAMSAWVPMFDRLAKVAPDEIQSDVEHIRDSLEAQQQSAGQAAVDPLGALGAGLVSGLRR